MHLQLTWAVMIVGCLLCRSARKPDLGRTICSALDEAASRNGARNASPPRYVQATVRPHVRRDLNRAEAAGIFTSLACVALGTLMATHAGTDRYRDGVALCGLALQVFLFAVCLRSAIKEKVGDYEKWRAVAYGVSTSLTSVERWTRVQF